MSDYITDDQGRTWMRVNSTRGTYYAPTFQSDFEAPPAPVVMYTAPYQPTYVENVFSTFWTLMRLLNAFLGWLAFSFFLGGFASAFGGPTISGAPVLVLLTVGLVTYGSSKLIRRIWSERR